MFERYARSIYSRNIAHDSLTQVVKAMLTPRIRTEEPLLTRPVMMEEKMALSRICKSYSNRVLPS